MVVKAADALAISATLIEKSIEGELCHLTIFPRWLLKVKLVLLGPEHTPVPPLAVPPTEVGITVSATGEPMADAHGPLVPITL